jgi:hypothetical protein
MYTKKPTLEVINITENNSEIIKNNQKEIINILTRVMEQNCFQIDQRYYKSTERLALGAPTSAKLAEAYV